MNTEDVGKPCSSSLQRYCEDLVDSGPSSRLAMLLAIPLRFKDQQMDGKTADSILSSIPEKFLTELLTTDDEQLVSFQSLAVDILETLLPYCNPSTLRSFSGLIPHLVNRLEATKDDINTLDSISKCIIALCFESDSGSVKFVHETADILTSFCVENSKYFPFIPILERLIDCMRALQHHDEDYELVSKDYRWPKNMRILVNAFLKTRTEVLSDKMRAVVFRLTKEIVETLGADWFAPDVNLLILLVHLIVVQTRMCLDKPTAINPDGLAVCFHILEVVIRYVEETSFVEDSLATQIAKLVREAALYSIQFWIEAKEEMEQIPAEVEVMIYRFTCCFLAIDGAKMLPKPLLQKCSLLMLQVFERSVSDGDFATARLLMTNLDALPRLSHTTVTLIADLVLAQYPRGDWEEAIDCSVASIKNLNSRVDYYSKESVKEACAKLEVIPNCKLAELLSNL